MKKKNLHMQIIALGNKIDLEHLLRIQKKDLTTFL